ncbi:hypothetical protein BD413DRAFT_265737 [Trametes elegans]|nr:hypothetical protein BD413DRAFT_265737 [Trametes elegans]
MNKPSPQSLQVVFAAVLDGTVLRLLPHPCGGKWASARQSRYKYRHLAHWPESPFQTPQSLPRRSPAVPKTSAMALFYCDTLKPANRTVWPHWFLPRLADVREAYDYIWERHKKGLPKARMPDVDQTHFALLLLTEPAPFERPCPIACARTTHRENERSLQICMKIQGLMPAHVLPDRMHVHRAPGGTP